MFRDLEVLGTQLYRKVTQVASVHGVVGEVAGRSSHSLTSKEVL